MKYAFAALLALIVVAVTGVIAFVLVLLASQVMRDVP